MPVTLYLCYDNFMAIRKITFVEDQYYHVFNRGVDKRSIFKDTKDIQYFLNRLADLNIDDSGTKFTTQRFKRKGEKIHFLDQQKLVSIVAYCLLPNHYHLILKQESENGISKFMQKLGTSHTMYFNAKYKRSGSLFQGKFKANMIDGDFGLPVLSVYVNLNYIHHKINPKTSLVKSSIFEYLGSESDEYICNKNELNAIVGEIGSRNDYQIFAKQTSKVFGDNKGLTIKDTDMDKIFE